MIRVGDYSSVQGLPLDQLPLEVLGFALWPYVVAEGARIVASLVCRAFAEADCKYLQRESNQILQDAQNNSGLYSLIKKRVAAPLETRESIYQFHRFILDKIWSLGGEKVAIDLRPLTAEEVHVKNGELEDRALENISMRMVTAIFKVKLDLAVEDPWKAADIRSWMKENPEMLERMGTLSLTNMELTMLPVEIGKFVNLGTLNIWHTQLREFPEEIGELKNLTGLFVHSNLLAELPNQMGQLTKLRDLNIASNRFREFPAVLGQMASLRMINAVNNGIPAVPASLRGRTNLIVKI